MITPETLPRSWKRNAVLFLVGQTVSLFGSMVVQYAVMWYVTLETRSGWAVALYTVAAFAPQGVVSLFGGVLADRVNRKLLAIVADVAIAVATLALALVMMNGIDDLWVILLAVAVRSVGAGVQTPTVQAMIPQIVPADQLMRINGMFQSIGSAMALIAPAVAAAVYAAFGIVQVFFLDVVTAIIGVALLAAVIVPDIDRSAQAHTSFREDLVEGMRYISTHRIVRWLLVVFAIIFLLTVAPSFITPLLVAQDFGPEEWKLAGLEMSFSIGMVLGGAIVSAFLVRKSRMALIMIATYAFGLLTAAMGVVQNLWVFFGLMGLIGLAVPVFSSSFMTLIQETVEMEMHGRVFSYVSIVMALATPVGMLAFGPAADAFGVRAILIAGGLATIAFMALAVMMPSGRMAASAAKEHTAAQAGEPALESGT
jgi:DHA3 family macrolide efflux protein-like MFS transporter